MFLILMTVISFISGSIPFCVWLPRIAAKKDICAISDDGNPGAFNVFKHCGKLLGSVCLALDVLKGFLPVFLVQIYGGVQNPLFALVITAPVFGHAFGLFNKFKGGKCISTSFGVAFGLIPETYVVFLLAMLYIAFSSVIKVRDHTKRSILAYSIFAVCAALILSYNTAYPMAVGCAATGIIVIIKHIL